MRTKDPGVWDDYATTQHSAPAIYTVLVAADAYAQATFGKHIRITRVHPTEIDEVDTHGLHAAGRAADLRIAHRERDGEGFANEITISEAEDLVDWINNTFAYGRTWRGTVTRVALLRVFRTSTGAQDRNTHIHLQVKSKKGWKAA